MFRRGITAYKNRNRQASLGKPESQIVAQLQQPILGLLNEDKEKKEPHKHNITFLREQVCTKKAEAGELDDKVS